MIASLEAVLGKLDRKQDLVSDCAGIPSEMAEIATKYDMTWNDVRKILKAFGRGIE